MVRTPSSYRATASTGKEFGVYPTNRDRALLTALARWYCLTADQIARLQLGQQAWEAEHIAGTGTRYESATARARRSIAKRLWKLSAIQENPGTHTGPLVNKTLSHTGQTAWFCTPYGGTVASVPWTMRSQISANYTDHAMMAADLGMHLEALGHTVYSEREVATMNDQHGERIHTPISSYFFSRNGQRTEKRPDLVIPSRDGTRFIAVEVERDRQRSLTTYTEKLQAYQQNNAITAVWYVCEFANTVNRVGEAAGAVFGDSDYPLRLVNIGTDHRGWKTIPGLAQNRTLNEDLGRLG